jgi:hypothetical protein
MMTMIQQTEKQKSKNMKLETKIRDMILEATQASRFNVVAHELWGEPEGGFSTNSSWYIASNADIDEVLEAARGRWEVFKANYLPKARVADIQDTGFNDSLSLEVDYLPFIDIRPAQ